MPLYHALGRYHEYNLKTILLQKGITPADLSKRAGGRISMSTVRNMVHRRRPSVREGTVRALARALGVSEQTLRGEQEWQEKGKGHPSYSLPHSSATSQSNTGGPHPGPEHSPFLMYSTSDSLVYPQGDDNNPHSPGPTTLNTYPIGPWHSFVHFKEGEYPSIPYPLPGSGSC